MMIDRIVKRTTTEVKLEYILLKWMRFMMSSFDHHHVGPTVGYHVSKGALGCSALTSGSKL